MGRPWLRAYQAELHGRGSPLCPAPIGFLTHATTRRYTQPPRKSLHTIEIQAGYTMEMQANLYNGDPNRYTEWRPKPVHIMEIEAALPNGDQSHLTQYKSRLAQTMVDLNFEKRLGAPLCEATWVSRA